MDRLNREHAGTETKAEGQGKEKRNKKSGELVTWGRGNGTDQKFPQSDGGRGGVEENQRGRGGLVERDNTTIPKRKKDKTTAGGRQETVEKEERQK